VDYQYTCKERVNSSAMRRTQTFSALPVKRLLLLLDGPEFNFPFPGSSSETLLLVDWNGRR
jgi:hypothetical protein